MTDATPPAQTHPVHSVAPPCSGLPAPRTLLRLSLGTALRWADALAGRWLARRLGVESLEDLAAQFAAQAYLRGTDHGFEQGLAVGCALGQHLEALHREEEVARWRRLAHWTARQRRAA